MKHLAASLVFVIAASAATADGKGAPIMEPEVVVDAASASTGPSAGFILGLMALVVFGTAASH